MAFEQREGFGSFFQNDKKGNEKAPDYKGEVMIGGNVYTLSGWKKLTSKSDPMLSLKAEVKAPRADTPPATAQKSNEQKIATAFDDFESIPF